MVEQMVTVINALGIHARPATLLAKLAGTTDGAVQIIKNGKSFNAKSMMALMSAAIKQGDQVTVQVDGGQEQQLLQAIVELFQAGFHEK